MKYLRYYLVMIWCHSRATTVIPTKVGIQKGKRGEWILAGVYPDFIGARMTLMKSLINIPYFSSSSASLSAYWSVMPAM